MQSGRTSCRDASVRHSLSHGTASCATDSWTGARHAEMEWEIEWEMERRGERDVEGREWREKARRGEKRPRQLAPPHADPGSAALTEMARSGVCAVGWRCIACGEERGRIGPASRWRGEQGEARRRVVASVVQRL